MLRSPALGCASPCNPSFPFSAFQCMAACHISISLDQRGWAQDKLRALLTPDNQLPRGPHAVGSGVTPRLRNVLGVLKLLMGIKVLVIGDRVVILVVCYAFIDIFIVFVAALPTILSLEEQLIYELLGILPDEV